MDKLGRFTEVFWFGEVVFLLMRELAVARQCRKEKQKFVADRYMQHVQT